ncbi:recombinase family protein [Mycobacteroides abscessus]|uniref:recombinase family protein n=1 Tax=Mycobacteroides abscessus TaxID=36809 RepID=UPI001F19E160|nr:recombinase family protein [Mycobacteroides abscessus]
MSSRRREALAVVREGDTLVVTKLDRLGRSILDLHRIANELTEKGVRLSWSGTVYNPLDPAGKLFFSMLAAFAEFESDLIRARTIEGMAEARKAGRIAWKKPKLTPLQQKRLYNDYESGQYTTAQLMELYPLKRSALYATIERERGRRELAPESLSKAG